MASRDLPSGYMDNIKVKISEKYKPPPRISVPMSYAQRLTLNKQIQDIPQYEFVLEKTVLEKMKEWKNARSVMLQELNSRLEKANADRKLKKDTKLEYEDLQQEDATSNNLYVNSGSSQNYQQSQSILMPTQATSSYSNILTPIPLKEPTLQQPSSHKSPDKSPFNISDFEADTSSPFDNMELKSINDMEELAQVLKSDQGVKANSNYNPPQSTSYSMAVPNNYTYSIPNTSYVPPVTSFYANRNGYYFPETQNFNLSYSYATPIGNESSTLQDTQTSSYKTVPEIMKSLQNELNNTHLDNSRYAESSKSKVRTKSEDVSDEFYSLPKNMQELSQAISSMGFPLSRVARVCKVVGDDKKKVVDHLLAMSELLDLGFSENSVSTALLQCDNDRDRALDILIS